MRKLNSRTLFSLFVVVLAATVAFTQAACDSGSPSGGRDYSQPLELTGIRYQSDSLHNALGTPSEINPGDMIALQGQNMDAVQNVYFNGAEASFNTALASENNLVVTVPPDLPFGSMDPNSETFNTIRVTNESSESTIDFQVLPPAPELQGMSNEYAEPGEEVTLTGQYLYLVQSITLPDETTVPREDIDASDDGTSATFTIPESASSETGEITYTTSSGTDASMPAFSYRDTEGLIVNFDDVLNWEWWNAQVSSDASTYPGADGSFAVMTSGSSGIAAGDEAWYAGTRSVNLTQGMQWVDPSNLDEPLSNFAVKFELAVEGEWNRGTLLLRVENDEGWTYSARYEPWRTNSGVEPVEYEGWRTVTVPLNRFRTWGGEGDGQHGGGDPPSSVSGLLPDGVAPYPGIMLINDTEVAMPANISLAVDNIRIVHLAE